MKTLCCPDAFPMPGQSTEYSENNLHVALGWTIDLVDTAHLARRSCEASGPTDRRRRPSADAIESGGNVRVRGGDDVADGGFQFEALDTRRISAIAPSALALARLDGLPVRTGATTRTHHVDRKGWQEKPRLFPARPLHDGGQRARAYLALGNTLVDDGRERFPDDAAPRAQRCRRPLIGP